MSRSILVLFATFFMFSVVKSQVNPIQPEQWEGKPVVHTLNSKYLEEPAVIVSDTRRIEYVDDAKDNMHLFYTLHKIMHVNNDHGIEYFNKIYIPMDGVLDMKEIHARAILPGGRVMEISGSSIKDLKDENDRSYKIFAMEGLEKGSDIEYYYTAERDVSYFGREQFQHDLPVLSSSLELVFPERLVFDIKPYNCKPVSRIDTLASGKTVFRSDLPEMTGAEEEKYSSYSASLSRLEYKLSYNNVSARRGQRLFTWNELAQKIYGMYNSISPKEVSRVKDFVKERGWAELKQDSDKIMAIENYVKNNFAYREKAAGNTNDLEKILKSKIGGMAGMMRLYAAIFNDLQISYQFVLTTDRDNSEIDKNFENWSNCDFAIFYFPTLRGYLVPSKAECRFPLIYPDWGGGNALFCKNVSIGGLTSAIAEVRQIKLEDFSKSFNNLDITLNLNEGLDSLLIDTRFIFGGYTAMQYREPFNMATEDQRKEIFKSMSKNQLNTESIVVSELENLGYEGDSKWKPFVVHQVVRSGDLVEHAGSKILVKIGMVIGPQVEMYQEKERRTPIAIVYPHFEGRKIRLIIPAGYRIKNPDDLRLKQVYEENGVQTMGFVSSYELKDNRLDIEIMEDYRKVSYPVSQYEQFVKIINASADFNKVVLVLEKNL